MQCSIPEYEVQTALLGTSRQALIIVPRPGPDLTAVTVYDELHQLIMQAFIELEVYCRQYSHQCAGVKGCAMAAVTVKSLRSDAESESRLQTKRRKC